MGVGGLQYRWLEKNEGRCVRVEFLRQRILLVDEIKSFLFF